MSEVLRNNPESSSRPPIDAISRFCLDIEFQSLLLPESQKKLYNPLLRTLRLAVERDRLMMQYLDYQKQNTVSKRLCADDLFFHSTDITKKYSKFEAMPTEDHEVFRTSHEGWTKGVRSPTVVGLHKKGTPQLVVRANYIGKTDFDNFVIPGTQIGAIRFDMENGCIESLLPREGDEIYSIQQDFAYTPFSEQYTDAFVSIMNETGKRVGQAYVDMLTKASSIPKQNNQ